MLIWKDIEWANICARDSGEDTRMIVAIGEKDILSPLDFTKGNPPGLGESYFIFAIKLKGWAIYTLEQIQDQLRELQHEYPSNSDENIQRWSPVLQDAIDEAHKRYVS